METIITIAITVVVTLIIVYALNYLKENKINNGTGGGQNTPDRDDENDKDTKLS